MKPLKIVIISQNCYPRLSPRAHRTTELAIELSRQGYNVTVYALLGNYDYSKISETTGVKFKSLGISKFGLPDNLGKRKNNYLNRIVRKMFRMTLEFPNIELFWMTKRVLKDEGDIDYLITVAHPHTIHWGASNFVKANKSKIKFWVADCGDPFMKDPFNKHPFYFSFLEKQWGRLCDYITVPIEESRQGYYDEFKGKIKVIPQGFSFENQRLAEYKQNEVITFAYSGVVYKDKRDPSMFLEYLCSLNIDFKFIVYTNNDSLYKPFMDTLGKRIELRSYIPREELLYELSKMDFLINIKNESGVQQPSKLIDYALTKRPIIEICSKFNQKEIFEQFLARNFQNALSIDNINKYNIKNVANQFIELFNLKR